MVDPLEEDLKKEREKLRSKPVYIDPEETEKQKIRQLKAEAAELISDFPMETNTYGKNRLALIEHMKDRKMAAGISHQSLRRTDMMSSAPPVDLKERDERPPPVEEGNGLSGALAKMSKEELEQLQ